MVGRRSRAPAQAAAYRHTGVAAASRGVGGVRAARVGTRGRAGWFPARRARRSRAWSVRRVPWWSRTRIRTCGMSRRCRARRRGVCHGLGEVFARVGMAPRVTVSGQRHGRGAPQRGRHGHADRDVPAVLRAVRVRGEVLQPVLGQREGQCGERGRVRAPQPGGAGPVGGGLPSVDARVVRRVRTARAGRPLPARRARRRPVRIGEGAYAPAAVRRVRPGRVAFGEGRPHRDRAGSTRTGTSPARNGIPCACRPG